MDIEKEERHLNKLKERRDFWRDFVVSTSKSLMDIKKLVEVQADLYSQRQLLLEERVELQNSLIKLNSRLRKIKVERYEYYEHNHDLRTRQSDRAMFIDNDMKDGLRIYDSLKNQIDFLQDTLKTLDSMIYGIKYRISMVEFE